MNEVEISIIVPVYKVKYEYLKECIESLLNQTFNRIEIILINDGSPDDCGKICDEYAKIDKRIKVIQQKNQGVSVARNVGMDIVKGKWICFVDSDDWVEKDMVEKLYSKAIENNSDIIMCAAYTHFSNKVLENPFLDENEIKLRDSDKEELELQIISKKINNRHPARSLLWCSMGKIIQEIFYL